MPGELLTRWTVRVALALYVAALSLRLAGGLQRLARWAWTLGCAFFVLHVAAAFHFYHAWRHNDAYAETARKTGEAIGLYWGGGIYINHLFLLVWLLDAAWWWLDADGYLGRPRAVVFAVQGFLAFIAFNGTVVFGHGFVRWAGLIACAWLVLLAWLGRRRAVSPSRPAPNPPPISADESRSP